jgi:hypothetical protein
MKTIYLLTLLVVIFSCSEKEKITPRKITDASAKKGITDPIKDQPKKALFYKNVGYVRIKGEYVGKPELTYVIAQAIVEQDKNGLSFFQLLPMMV